MSYLSEKYGEAQVAFLLEGLVALRSKVENAFEGEADPREADYHGICWNMKERYIDLTEQFPADLLALYGHYRDATRQGLVEVWSELRDELFESWPEFSGNLWYPVPGVGMIQWEQEDVDGIMYPLSESEYREQDAEYTFDEMSGSMWEGEYGQSRRRLLSYMIDQLTKESVAP